MHGKRLVCLFLLLAGLGPLAGAQVLWFAYPNPVPFEQVLTLTIENRVRCTIYLPNSAPWAIYDAGGQLVFAPLSLPVVVPIKPLQARRWTWNQKDRHGRQVPAAVYEARITYMDCAHRRYVLKTKFRILPVYLKAAPTTIPPGGRVTYNLHAPTSTGRPYQAACSLGDTPGIPLAGNRLLALNPDWLFLVSLLFPGKIFENFSGLTSKSGYATAYVNVPRNPALIGIRYYTAFVTFRASAPGGVDVYSTSKGVLIK